MLRGYKGIHSLVLSHIHVTRNMLLKLQESMKQVVGNQVIKEKRNCFEYNVSTSGGFDLQRLLMLPCNS